MDRTERLRANAPHVVAEVLDGELIILNFESGTYYSVGGSGADIWAMLEAGHSCAAIAARGFGGGSDTALGVETFVDNLVSEGLVVSETSNAAAPSDGAPSLPDGPFVTPVLEKHTDLQELLLLDPIHDVDEAGWPHRPD